MYIVSFGVQILAGTTIHVPGVHILFMTDIQRRAWRDYRLCAKCVVDLIFGCRVCGAYVYNASHLSPSYVQRAGKIADPTPQPKAQLLLFIAPNTPRSATACLDSVHPSLLGYHRTVTIAGRGARTKNWTATPDNCIGSQGRLGGTWPTGMTTSFSNTVCHTACCIENRTRRVCRTHAKLSLPLTPVVRNRVTWIRPRMALAVL